LRKQLAKGAPSANEAFAKLDRLHGLAVLYTPSRAGHGIQLIRREGN